jgi:hypothetical protein
MKAKKRYTVQIIIQEKWMYFFGSESLPMAQAIAGRQEHYRILDGTKVLEEK